MLIRRQEHVRVTNKKTTVENKTNEETFYLYGDIGGYWGNEASDWVRDFNAIDAKTIHLRIDSDGGDVFAARAMKTAIMQHSAKVIAHIDGLAASAASFVAMGADEIEIVEGGFLMVHNALSYLDIYGYFNSDDMVLIIDSIKREMALHEKINESIASDYAKKSGKTQEEALAWMAEETWFTAQEALENGLVDRIYDGDPVEGSYDLSIYAKAPDALKERNTKASKRTVEKAMRDAGISAKVAKKALSEEFEENYRDGDDTEGNQTELEQRDVVEDQPKKGSVEELLILAEMMAPTI